MRNRFEKATMSLVRASSGNPVITTATILLFYVMFNTAEALIEKLIFGERFEHWLDPIFIMLFMCYSAYAVWWCAIFNTAEKNN